MCYVEVSCSQILRKLKGALDIEIMSGQYKDHQDFFVPHKCMQAIQEYIVLYINHPKIMKAPKVTIIQFDYVNNFASNGLIHPYKA